MLRYSLVFLVVAVIAGLLGFSGIAGEATWIARVLFLAFVILYVVSFILGKRGPSAEL
ncbi:DUF1328 domain-containing protein [Tuwongella immobilis]|uniref:Uncharacterized protein n=1 Tax=Tuwongella immobilis TaxID=692036 RepID=A0A6C2YQ63_9BACT|nr:DUF1328 domain-containing protein [Tuwongella immobilis]VIP03534.1 membrane protein : Uncharacterized protein OS=Chthoniobacter flavus Ellin428 GN=CfE428DRAFT_0794 PE=3 SV=1: DUF1328 [Tuwongella immobilis]VTS04436.1 membrane protein : Uncharacterized protein OS=Chthoniobacter flavus Ellin428 GN=CfE428DRAFT_0794 PE=3 SV=1: DUF1328 [Tuwongella immobilis]